MNILITSVGRRGYIAEYFRQTNPPCSLIVGTTDRHSKDREFTVGLTACDRSYIVPSVTDPAYIDAVMDICIREKIGLVFSLLDIDNYVLSQHLASFKSIGVVPFVSSPEVNEICLDKFKTFEFLQGAGLDTPATYASLDDFCRGSVRFPVVVKPRNGCASEGLVIVQDIDHLKAIYKEGSHVIQECIEGDEYGLDILNDLDGNLRSYVVKKKIRMRAGETDQAVTVKNEALAELAVVISKALGHCGPMDVDVLVSGGRLYIIDFNPRFGGGYPLAHAAGANFPQIMVDIATDVTPTSAVADYEENIVMLKDTGPRTFKLEALSGLPLKS